MKKVRLIQYLFFCIIICNSTLGQVGPGIRWQKCIGGSNKEIFDGQSEYFSDIGSLSARIKILNVQGNYIVAGTSYSATLENEPLLMNYGHSDIIVGEMDKDRKWIWKKNYGGSNMDQLLSIQPANDSGYILIGTTKSNNRDVSGNHGNMDIWVVRLGRKGNIIWQKCFGGSGDDVAASIQRIPGNGYAFIGSSKSNNGDLTENMGLEDIWAVRLDNSGNINWQKSFGGSGSDLGATIRNKPGGGFYIGGQTLSNNGLFIGNHSSIATDIWMADLDADGNVIKTKCFGGSSGEFLNDFELGTDGSIFISGMAMSNNGDVSGNHRSGQPDGWVVKLSPSLDIIWQKCFGGSDVASFQNSVVEDFEDIEITPDGNLIVAGMTGSNDGDIKNSQGNGDCWIAKVSPNGDLIWSKAYGGTGTDLATSIAVINEDEFIFLGNTSSNNGDVLGNFGMDDIWLVSLGQANLLSGEVFIDRNHNNIKDLGEPSYLNSKIVAAKAGIDSTSIISSTGKFNLSLDTGTYITKVYPYLPYYVIIPVSHTTSHADYFNTDSVKFALQPITGIKDLRVSAISLTPSRPGFQTDYKLSYENIGTDEFPVGVIQFIKDSRLNLVGTEPAYDYIAGDTILWNFYDFKPFDKSSIAIHFSVLPPPSVNVGDSLHSAVYILPAENDLTPNDDSAKIVQLVVGSFDPNDKTEMHGGLFKIKEPSNSEYLNYMVRFQNTGTDTAFNVTIKDTLSSKLDWNSLEMISASHNYQLNINKGNICTWKFSNILLPDSNRNEPGSHGYLAFRIKPVSGIAHGIRVDNKADIYFDYNLPVTTNVSSTLVKLMIPEQPALSNYQSTYCVPGGPQKIKIVNLPSSDYSASVEVKLDGTVLPVALDSSITLLLSAMQKGTHVLTVTYSNALATKTGTFNFSVNAIAAPEVNVSANTSSVINLTDPSIVTAINIAAGGSVPLFTFARDRLFSSVIQAEGINNTVSLYARDLSIGENMIYVRMKSNDPCSSLAYDIDSIKITRSSVTGVTDTDFPNQLINIYPNPFKQGINVAGLSSSKQYSIRISNQVGQLVYEKKIRNSTSTIIQDPGLQPGAYWLSIFDEKKKSLIGTAPLIKE